MSSVEDMLAKARLFYTCSPPVERLPATFENEEQAISAFIASLLFEANQCMQDKIDFPELPIMNAVDLESNEPGIIEAMDGSEVKIARSKNIDIPKIVYQRRTIETIDVSKKTNMPPGKIEKLLDDADRQRHVAFEREQTREVKKVVAHKARKEKQLQTKDKTQHPDQDATTELNEAVGDEAVEKNENGEAQERNDAKLKRDKEAKKERNDNCEKKETKRLNPSDLDIEYANSNDSIKRRKSNKCDISVYQSPIPHDRHLTALTNCSIHPAMRGTLLRGENSSHIKAVLGPPGTGKTTFLLSEVKSFIAKNPASRVAICSPTNSNAADLYHRALKLGIVGYLGLSKKNIPVGVPKRTLVNESNAKVIFCTISGRNGAKLRNQRVHAIFIDEAAMVPESLTWGLLREEVEYLFMVGDIKQLPAMVSKEGQLLCHNRSLLERLSEQNFPITTLNEQRRMHPEILRFPNNCFYGGELRTSPMMQIQNLKYEPYKVINVHGEEQKVGTSFKNTNEAIVCVEIAKELRTSGLKVQILVPYVAQVNEILAAGSGFSVCTIDSFQGKEEDVVILCTVRTSSDGFWEDSRRLCVALTRAKHVLRVVGNFSRSSSSLHELVADAKRREVFENVC